MEAYEAKATVWNIDWDSHKIRFEFITKNSKIQKPLTFLFFDGKCVATSDKSAIEARVQTDNGNSYLIVCAAYRKFSCNIQWPSRKSFWGRIEDLLDKLITSNQYVAECAVNGDLIYLSHIGGADRIEWVEIQEELDQVAREERALAEGKIMVLSSDGYCKEKASKEKLEETKLSLIGLRKALESKLSSWEAKYKRNQ